MSAQGVTPETVIARLANQIGQMAAELAMRDAVIEAQQTRIAELESVGDETGEQGAAGSDAG